MRRTIAVLATSLLTIGTLMAQGQSRAVQTHRTPRTLVKKPSLLSPATLTGRAPDVYRVQFTTTRGVFVAEVHRSWSPIGADRFYHLAKNGFYDGASFFRVVPGFVVQFGISAKPAITSAWRSATIQDDPVVESNHRGYLTFAKKPVPNTRTTQIFINLADNTQLDGMGFSPFAQVVEGMEVVDQLYGSYGDAPPQGSGPDQGRIETEGRAYLDKDFPKLDSIKSTSVVPSPGGRSPK